jgi:hypothetical protein
MSQPTINTTPLFRTSLRSWQASYKANRPQAESPAEPPAQAPSGVVARPNRFGRRKRRVK